MQIPFQKWHGLKNDFVVFWISELENDFVLKAIINRSVAICMRDGSGVGADGVLVIVEDRNSAEKLSYQLVIINADGSIAQNCGNGLRCAAARVREKIMQERKVNDPFLGEESLVEFTVEGRSFSCRFVNTISDDSYFEVVMGHVVAKGDEEIQKTTIEKAKEVLRQNDISFDFIEWINAGNNHLNIFLDDQASIKEKFHKVASSLSTVPEDGINVHFVQRLNASQYIDSAKEKNDLSDKIGKKVTGSSIEDKFNVLTWERGVGPTQACGSGATAVAASAYRNDEAFYDRWVGVVLPGGNLFIRSDGESEEFRMIGPATKVYDGSMQL